MSATTTLRVIKRTSTKPRASMQVQKAFRTMQDFVQMIDEELLHAELAPRLKHVNDASRWLSLEEVARTITKKK